MVKYASKLDTFPKNVTIENERTVGVSHENTFLPIREYL